MMAGSDIGIDLGTASILVYIKGKGVVLKEPSVVAFDRDTNRIKAIGEEALAMLKDFDQVAYIRFASVYKDFDDKESFIKIISELDTK